MDSAREDREASLILMVYDLLHLAILASTNRSLPSCLDGKAINTYTSGPGVHIEVFDTAET